MKAVPLGGFCDIAGMTSVEELAPEDRQYAMYRQKVWKRVAVLFAGPGVNFVIGLVLLYAIAVVWGLPNLHPPTTAIVGETACVSPEVTQGQARRTATGPGPAALAGIKPGDTVVKVGGTDVSTFEEMVAAVRKLDAPTPFVVERTENGQAREFTTTVDVTKTQRFTKDGNGAPATSAPSASRQLSSARRSTTRSRPSPATVAFTGDLMVELGKSLAKIPTKIGALWHSIGGGERDPETPISVVGASIIGGDTVDARAVGGVLVLPRPAELRARRDQPGSAVAVRRRSHRDCRVREDPQYDSVTARGIVAAGPVNYLKLMPATYVVLVVVGGYMLLTVTADLVNPIRLFQ